MYGDREQYEGGETWNDAAAEGDHWSGDPELLNMVAGPPSMRKEFVKTGTPDGRRFSLTDQADSESDFPGETDMDRIALTSPDTVQDVEEVQQSLVKPRRRSFDGEHQMAPDSDF